MAPTKICELSQFTSLVNSLKPITSTVLHFTPDLINIHMVNTSNNVFVCVEYKTDNAIETSFALDLDTWTSIKNNEVALLLDDIILQVKVGKVTHKCRALADPKVTSRDREAPNPDNWPHCKVTLSNDDMKALVGIISSTGKYDFKVESGTLCISDCDQKVEMNIDSGSTEPFKSRFGGTLLEDVLFAPKYFEKCDLYIGNNTPLTIDYSCEWLKCRYIVAPMIEEED